MKKLIAIAALAALSACADDDAAAPAAEDQVATEEVAEPSPAATATNSAGTYEYERDGVATVATLNPDGSYTDTQNGTVVESGTWVDREGKLCLDAEGDPEAMCWAGTRPGTDGNYTSTADDGTTRTVRRTN